MKYTAEDILSDREKRVELQNRLMERLGIPLVSLRVNYPGLNKNNTITNNIIQDMDKIITDIFSASVAMRLFRITAEGPNLTMAINKNPVEIKKTAILIENNHTLGRCIDIDVYDNNTGEAISRKDLGMDYRKCYLCDDMAQNCVRSKRHTEAEVIKFIQDTYKEFMEGFYSTSY